MADTPAGFSNEPILELRRASERDSLLAALRELDERLPLSVPVLIGGDRGAAEGIDSTDPGAPRRLVARAGRAGEDDAAAAVEAARAASATGARARPPSAPRRCAPPPRACASAA